MSPLASPAGVAHTPELLPVGSGHNATFGSGLVAVKYGGNFGAGVAGAAGAAAGAPGGAASGGFAAGAGASSAKDAVADKIIKSPAKRLKNTPLDLPCFIFPLDLPCFIFPPLFSFDFQIASAPFSPVRIRMTSSTLVTKIFPSPILPVRAVSVMTSTTFAALSSGTRIWIFTLGKKSTEYSAPR